MKRYLSVPALSIFLLLLAGVGSMAQSREQFQAHAFGQGTQMGRNFSVSMIVDEYSTPEDQKALLEAFSARGSEGLTHALEKMHSKGRISMPGTLGYDLKYIRVFTTPNGRKLRMITDRPITFGEAWGDTRSSDYTLSAIELDLDNEGKGKGTLIPACQLKLNKANELELEAFQNPWRLENVFKWK